MKHRIDLANLISALVSLDAPSPLLDRVIHVMLAGRKPNPVVTAMDVRLGMWIDGDAPGYTAGSPELSGLAYRLGVTIEIAAYGNGYTASAIQGVDRHVAFARIPAAAICAALALRVASAAAPQRRPLLNESDRHEPVLVQAGLAAGSSFGDR